MFRNGRIVLFLILCNVCGCASVARSPVPEDQHLEVRVLGRTDLRTWGDLSNSEAVVLNRELLDEEGFRARHTGIMDRPHHYLTISGGGADGAYGAGILVGWSDMGTRPEFTVVTGVSTGAIIAPFAYLGSAYDKTLQYVYTHLDSSEIFSIFERHSADSLVDTAPLAQALERYVTDEMIAAIAAEHRRGRQLLIGTTNLDAGRPVIWNIGRIANTGHPDAADFIRSLILASASIPGAFPPVYVQVEGTDGKLYDEMHVDGGAATQMFLYPSGIDWVRSLDILNVKGKPVAYVIRNARLRTDYAPVDPNLVSIGQRTINSMIRTQSIGDAYRILALAKRDGLDLFMTWIPERAVEEAPAEAFDPNYMSKLFEYGYRRVQEGGAWVDDSIIDKGRD